MGEFGFTEKYNSLYNDKLTVIENKIVEVVDFDSMSKKQLDNWADNNGIKIDRRTSKEKMIEELKKVISNE